ncbi:ATP-binding protein [Brunnivagina elsteri]|uniref:Circadian input-output histidine kinase CikA n=1 Tax=Brunnivagina elsteri CCALA 953 TaxID=987040 RepID=A0A2A2TI54_9CYAN|nr:ATP-binding protein [Calothrix elsteri]PAX53371.1 two-component sensor histidine kinase [Calothrix elsteri CCALA 953]
MSKPRQLSFRRLLMTRILLLSVPVLLIGEIVIFKKARYTQLDTARQNLTENAILKGEKILDTVASLKANLSSASQTEVMRSGSILNVQLFMNLLEQNLPKQIECIQFSDLAINQVVASTCGDEPLDEESLKNRGTNLTSSSERVGMENNIQIRVIVPPKVYIKSLRNKERGTQNKLQLILTSPVYDNTGNIRYLLSIQSELQQKVKDIPGLLTGSTVVISDNGTILAHPIPQRIGTNIAQHSDASRLKKIVRNAIAGKQDSLQFFFEKQGEELLAGYTAIPSPIPNTTNQKWVILDVITLDNALYGLKAIKIILVVLTIVLIGTCVLVSLYIARYLANPLEQLRDYALNIHSSSQTQPVPQNFHIREFNQLAQAIDRMVERLKVWAEEIENSWQDAKTANQVKSQFLATTSHELRNPLNVIINCVRVVREDLCDNREEELEFLQRADETAIHLLAIINDLLDISKIEAGKLSVFLEHIDLRQILKDVINLQSVNIQQKGLHLNIPEFSAPMLVKADPQKFKQVLINVIGNATKFTEEGSITISVEIERQNQLTSQPQVIIKIKDTGIGIESNQQQKLFRPYVMVEGSTNRKFEGTGLGLAISRNLMELMEGTINLESTGINQGTTATIILPLVDIPLLPMPQELPIIKELVLDSQNDTVARNKGKKQKKETEKINVVNINPIQDFPESKQTEKNQLQPEALNQLDGESNTISNVNHKVISSL